MQNTNFKAPLPFEGRIGKGVRVAVIDSGVNVRHPHIIGVAGGASVPLNGEITEGEYNDVLGHGTAVTAAIQDRAPGAEYIAVKLFHEGLRTTTQALLRAIEWAIEQRVDLVNLSLGTCEQRFVEHFREVVAHGLAQGVMLVSALDSDGTLCLPGSLPGVLGVGLDWDCPRCDYRCAEGPVFYASGYPRSLPGVAPQRNLHGISFAVANMTGMIACACEGLTHRSPETISIALIEESARLNALAAQ